MAFTRRKSPYRGFELTSLIDIVFLLLIFFLVSFAFSLAGDVDETQTYSEMKLPKTNTLLPVLNDDVLDNLMIQIGPDSGATANVKRVYVLWPEFEPGRRVTRLQALARAQADSTFADYPSEFIHLPPEAFESLEANRLIRDSIRRYVELEQFYRRTPHPVVEVRAHADTEFRILSFILNRCADYGDVVPQIIIRTST